MDAHDLSGRQVRLITDRLDAAHDYVVKLTDRMAAAAWSTDDPAYRAACEARDALQEAAFHLRNPMPCERPPWWGPKPTPPGGREGA